MPLPEYHLPIPTTEAGRAIYERAVDNIGARYTPALADEVRIMVLKAEAEAVSAERARIRAAVEAEFAEASVDNEPGEFTCLSERAILAIIDRDDAPER